MRFRSQLLWTLVIQGGGAAAVFGAVVLLGSMLGPQAQGLFSRAKTELEFVTALSLLGMPQAMFFFVTSRRMSRGSALWVTSVVASLAAIASLSYIGLTHSVDAVYLAIFAAAATAMVAHSMLRVLVLADASTRLFNAVTALPQVALLSLVLIVVAVGSLEPRLVAAVFLLAFTLGSVFAWWGLRVHAVASVDGPITVTKWKELVAYGAAAWSVAVFNSAANVLWLRHIESTLGLAAVGLFTMGLVFVQVVLTPINYAVPLLFKRWMATPGFAPKVACSALVSGLATSLVIAPLLAIQGMLPIPAALQAYAALSDLKWTFAAVAVVEVVVRIAAVGANAAGQPWGPSLAELMRLIFLAMAISLGLARLLPSMAMMWAGGAAIAAFTVLVLRRRSPSWKMGK